MRNLGILVAVLLGGCASSGMTDRFATGPAPKLFVFDGGSGRVADFDREFPVLAASFVDGVPAQPLTTGRWRHQLADGTLVEREMVLDEAGNIASLRLYRTSMDGTRSGFRVVGPLAADALRPAALSRR